MLALHLLQNALVSINTLMLQRVLSEAAWATRLTGEDLRALTPLISAHVSPYGHFLLDTQTRLGIELPFDAGHGSDTAPIDPESRPPAHARRSRRAKAQQLALFSLCDSEGRRVRGWHGSNICYDTSMYLSPEVFVGIHHHVPD